jgi:hypothetical protein
MTLHSVWEVFCRPSGCVADYLSIAFMMSGALPKWVLLKMSC